MTIDDLQDTTIADLHRIRREIAARFQGDLFALSADAQSRAEASGRQILRRPKSSPTALPPSAGSGTSQVVQVTN
jgi:hypothetical protein